MGPDGSPSLRRLLGPRATPFLESFSALAPELGLALVQIDLRAIGSAGSWPQDALPRTLASAGAVLRALATPSSSTIRDGPCRYHLLSAGSRVLGALIARGQPSSGHEAVEGVLHQTFEAMVAEAVEKRDITNEALDGYRELSLLSRIGETIGRSLNPHELPSMVLEQGHLIPADVGLLLVSAGNDPTGSVTASFGPPARVAAAHHVVRGISDRLCSSGRPAILSHVAHEDSSFAALLWAPLRSTDRVWGGIVLARETGPVFTARDEKLLVALADPSAAALENARLFELVERQRHEEQRLLDVTSAVASELALDALLGKIINVATELLDADRSTLFLYDARTDELWSRVAEGVDVKEIRFPRSAGLAGTCFTAGEVINIREAHDDARFNAEVDRKTGYRTHSILCMPVATKDAHQLGVIQVLNKKGGPFNSADERRLRAFTAQVAIALENARLFEDVINERNYNESVLKSLSNGVITLSAGGTVAKVNQSVSRIFDWQADQVTGRPVADLFSRPRNAWVLQGLERVKQSGNVDITMDADIELDNGRMVSTNMTVAPLVDVEGESIGSMIVVEDLSKEKRIKGTMARYMSKELADRVLEAGEERLGGTSQVASVLFSDIRAFTTISETLGARDTVSMLNEYFGVMVDVVFGRNGILDKYIGDAIMAVFGVPFPTSGDADNAVLAAGEMMLALRRLNEQREAQGKTAIRTGIGISTGELIAGNIGSAKRMDYTVIGDTVNLAARLESATKYYGVDTLISQFTSEQLTCAVRLREIDVVRVKGRTEPVSIYQALNHHCADSFPGMDGTVNAFEEGLGRYRSRDWKAARRSFREGLSHNSMDVPCQLYVQRCMHYLQHPPPEDWSGVWTMETK